MNEDSSSEVNYRPRPRRKQASFYEIIFSLMIFIYSEYLLKKNVECIPSLNGWYSMLISVAEVLFICDVVSRVDFGKIIHNAQKLLKILSYLVFIFICFHGLYKSYIDETCANSWPLGYYSMIAISLIPVLYFLTLATMLIYLISSEHSSKE